jgi:predicted DCC family thiol-disulfide oxidoreductase YuxK
MARNAWVIIDGECGLCKRFGAWVRRMDSKGRFTVVPYQIAPDPPATPQLKEHMEKSMHVVDEAGNVYRGGDAFVYLRRAFQTPLSGIMGWQPFKVLVDAAYYIVSTNRDKFARFLYTKEVWTD